MSVGEAACVSVHGANRLGSNSLTDLVVFGRAAGLKAGEIVDRTAGVPEIPASATDAHLARFDCFRNAKGSIPTAELRLRMQMAMQEDAAVFRTAETLEQGVKRLTDIFAQGKDIGVTDRGLVWNSDLMETLEYDNLIGQAVVTIVWARSTARKVGRARRLPRAQRRDLDETHPRLARRSDRQGETRFPPGPRLHPHQGHRLHPAEKAGVLMASA